MNYVKIEDDVVVNRTTFDGPMPEGWAAGDWRAHDTAQIGWVLSGGELQEPPSDPPPPIEDVKDRYSGRIDADAEAVRLRYITPGDGMAMTYQEKFAQAQAVASLGETTANAMSQVDREAQFPTLSASIGIESPSLWGCAQLVLQKYAQFAALSFHIERARLAGKAAIADAADVDGVRAAYAAVTWPTP